MMTTTHVLAGVVLGITATALTPAATPAVVIAAAFGGAFPDLDIIARHRRTLHFPVYYTLLAIVALASAALVGTTAALAVGLFFAAAAVHSLMDVIGGGLSLRPWQATSDRAVYDHFRGQWHSPRRLIKYDGSPADFALACLFAIPGLVFLPTELRMGVFVLLGISLCYTLVRKRLVTVGQWLVTKLPASILRIVPEPLIEDFR